MTLRSDFIFQSDTLCFVYSNIEHDISVKISLQMKIMMPFNSEPITVVEKFSTSIKFQSFMIPDESIWKQLEVILLMRRYFSCGLTL